MGRRRLDRRARTRSATEPTPSSRRRTPGPTARRTLAVRSGRMRALQVHTTVPSGRSGSRRLSIAVRGKFWRFKNLPSSRRKPGPTASMERSEGGGVWRDVFSWGEAAPGLGPAAEFLSWRQERNQRSAPCSGGPARLRRSGLPCDARGLGTRPQLGTSRGPSNTVGSTAAARRQPQAAALLGSSKGGTSGSSLRIVLEGRDIAGRCHRAIESAEDRWP